MTKNVQNVRQSTAVASTWLGLLGQFIMDLGLNTIRVHDGATPGGFPLLGAANNLSDLLNVATARTNLSVYSKAEAAALGVVIPGTFTGCNTSRNAGTPNTKIDITSGFVADDTNVAYMTCPAGTLDATTVGANGLDAGALANSTWYYLFAIGKLDGTVAYILTTSTTTPAPMPAGYIYKRLVWFAKTNGSAQFINARQVDDDFFWDAAPIDALNATPANTNNVAVALSVPSGYKVRPLFSFRGSANPTSVLFTLADGGATVGAAGSQWFITTSAGSDAYEIVSCLRTNITKQIMVQANTTASIYSIFTLGFNWNRGRT